MIVRPIFYFSIPQLIRRHLWRFKLGTLTQASAIIFTTKKASPFLPKKWFTYSLLWRGHKKNVAPAWWAVTFAIAVSPTRLRQCHTTSCFWNSIRRYLTRSRSSKNVASMTTTVKKQINFIIKFILVDMNLIFDFRVKRGKYELGNLKDPTHHVA